MYAVIPSPSGNNGNLLNKEFKNNELKIIQPGVIYCLRQKNELKEGTQINPLNPYFLVYVYDDGTVKYNRGVVNPGIPLILLDGSRMLKEQANAIGLNNPFYTWYGQDST